MNNKQKKGMIGIMFLLIVSNLVYGLNVDSLDPEFEIEMDTDYRIETFNAYLEKSGIFYNLSYIDEDGVVKFFLKDNDYVDAGNYNFVLRYLDYDNSLNEKYVDLDISRPALKLVVDTSSGDIAYKEENGISYILVKDKDEELIIRSTTTTLSAYRKRLFKSDYESTNNIESSPKEEEDMTEDSIKFDLSELSENEEYTLQLKIFDEYGIEYSTVYQYRIIIDETDPVIDVEYGENKIYSTVLNLKINASEEVVCKYSHDDYKNGNFGSTYSKDQIFSVANLDSDGKYDFEVVCKDKVGNEASEEFTIKVDATGENEILSVLPSTYLGKDLKVTISTNRESECSYNLTGYDKPLTKITGVNKVHEVSLTSFKDIDLKENIHINVYCEFGEIGYGADDSLIKKLYLDFEPPVLSIDAKDTFEDKIYTKIEIQDNYEIDECSISLDEVKYTCKELGIDLKDNSVNDSFEFIQKLEDQKTYKLCLSAKDVAGNLASIVCDNFKKDIGLMPGDLATCSDGYVNQGESAVDCGGPCNACPIGSVCNQNSDCENSADCVRGRCQLNHCYNDIFDKDLETALDCGDECSSRGLYCSVNVTCSEDSDCDSEYCDDTTNKCTIPTCDDGVKNQDESDIDCGGVCDTCEIGNTCKNDDDCVTGVCSPSEKKCSQYTKEDLEAQKKSDEEEAEQLGYKEKNPLSGLLYVALGFVVLIVLSLGYYSYAHREKNNFSSHNSFDQSRQKQSRNNSINRSFVNTKSDNYSRMNLSSSRLQNNKNTRNSKIDLNSLNKISTSDLKGKLESLDKSNLGSNLKSSDLKDTINKLKSNKLNISKLNIKKLNLTKDSLNKMSKEDLLQQLKSVKDLKTEVELKKNSNMTEKELNDMKMSAKKEAAKKEMEQIVANKKIGQSRDAILSKEIEDLLDLKTSKDDNENKKIIKSDLKSGVKLNTKSELINKDIKNKKTEGKIDVFNELEKDLEEDENIYDEIDKI